MCSAVNQTKNNMLKHEARLKDGRKIGEFGSKKAAENHIKKYGGYTTEKGRGSRNWNELKSDVQWSS